VKNKKLQQSGTLAKETIAKYPGRVSPPVVVLLLVDFA
jgi:hypothetical protein